MIKKQIWSDKCLEKKMFLLQKVKKLITVCKEILNSKKDISIGEKFTLKYDIKRSNKIIASSNFKNFDNKSKFVLKR